MSRSTLPQRIKAAQRRHEQQMLVAVRQQTKAWGAYWPVVLSAASWNALGRLVAKGRVVARRTKAGGYVPAKGVR